MNYSTMARNLACRGRLAVAALLLALPASLLAVTQPAEATAYIVSNTNDSGPGSLRQAINDAKSHSGPDTITFAAVTNGNPIVLAGAAAEDGNASGDLDIKDADDLTIQGNGSASTIVDGGGIDRVFHICPGGGCTNTVTLTGVTISNGNIGSGGGTYNQATLNIQNCTIGGAAGGNVAWNGGGIYSTSGSSTTVDGSTISANGADRGGGIYNNGTLSVTNSTIGGAGADNAATSDGGGIYNAAGGSVVVDGSNISANTANNGGGIFNEAALVVQNGSTIGEAGAPNLATDAGGGICSINAGSTTTVDGSSVSANEAKYCGGIFSQGTLKVQSGSTVGGAGAGNVATVFGGGICNMGGTGMVDNSTVRTNTAPDGGGIYNYAAGTMIVTGSKVSANEADNGGGIYTWDNSTTTVDSSTIGGNGAGNTATTFGGGIYNYTGGTTIVAGSRILDNTAANGGAVYNDQNVAGATNVSGSCIVGNSNTSFHNRWAAQQIATANWWGAATGPNTLGADTVSDDVLYSGFLTSPPFAGCGYRVALPIVLR